MSNQESLSRLFGGCLGEGLFGGLFEGGGIILIILAVILLLGDDLLEFLFCGDNILIWIILLLLLVTSFDFDGGCGCC
ncbi:MAG: hypothetical protein ACRCXA_13815 [Peptostreptococcaceae bacterium]